MSFDSSPRLQVIADQVIDVPKISQDRTQQRLVDYLRQLQTAEQLVEVPTIVSYSSLHRNVQQNVDIPVPHRRGGRGGLQDLRPGQDSTAFCGADHVDKPVPRVGGPQGFLPRQASAASSSHSPGAADEALQGVLALITKLKKCEVGSALGVGTGRGLGVSMAVEEDESEPVTESELEDEGESNAWVDDSGDSWMLVHSVDGPSGTRRGGVYSDRSSCFQLSRAVHTGILDITSSSSCIWQALTLVNPRLLLQEFQLSLGDCAVRTWKSGHYWLLLFAQYLARQWIQVLQLCLEVLDEFQVFSS